MNELQPKPPVEQLLDACDQMLWVVNRIYPIDKNPFGAVEYMKCCIQRVRSEQDAQEKPKKIDVINLQD